MAWQPKSDEAYEVSNTFHVALALIGAGVYAALFALWSQVVTPTPGRAQVTATRWSTSAESIISHGRTDASDLASSYLMLHRALNTGYTMPPRGGGSAPTSLDELRRAFVEKVRDLAPSALRNNIIPDPTPTDGHDDRVEVDPPSGVYRPYSPNHWGGDLVVGVEEIDGLDAMLDTLDEWSAKETRNVLDDLGIKRLLLKLQELERPNIPGPEDMPGLTPQQLDAAREEASAIVGRGVAAHGERIALNGGRQAEIAKGRRDPRVKGFVRVHFPEGDVNPCGFCALLISRGMDEIYSSKKIADGGANFDQFHAGCHCRAVEVYSASTYETDAQYALNREYRKLWDTEFRDQYAGNNAAGIAAWRRLFRDRKAEARSQAA